MNFDIPNSVFNWFWLKIVMHAKLNLSFAPVVSFLVHPAKLKSDFWVQYLPSTYIGSISIKQGKGINTKQVPEDVPRCFKSFI